MSRWRRLTIWWRASSVRYENCLVQCEPAARRYDRDLSLQRAAAGLFSRPFLALHCSSSFIDRHDHTRPRGKQCFHFTAQGPCRRHAGTAIAYAVRTERRTVAVRVVSPGAGQARYRSLPADLPGRLWLPVRLAEYLATRRALAVDRTMRSAAGTRRPDRHWRRRCAGDGRIVCRRASLFFARSVSLDHAAGHGHRGHDRRRTLDRAVWRSAPMARCQRNHLQPAAFL